MKILSAQQIRELDKYIIEHEPISSIDLMERAAIEFSNAIDPFINYEKPIFIFCGMGNNGGDGLETADLLIEDGFEQVHVYVIKHTSKASADFSCYEKKVKGIADIHYIKTAKEIPAIEKDTVVIDAIFGTGLSRPAEGIAAEVIRAINQSGANVYSIDVPSGLFCDQSNSPGDAIIRSTITYTFHTPKLTFLFPSNEEYVPRFEVLDINVVEYDDKEVNDDFDFEYEEHFDSSYHYLLDNSIRPLFKKRDKFSHKGTYGHALIAAGSYGKMGAAVLAVKAALRSGAGLVSANIPSCGYDIMQTSNPEAMVEADKADRFMTVVLDLKKYSVIGIGPGIGTNKETTTYLKSLLKTYKKPVVLDADALNIIAANKKDFLPLIPENSILTPHPGEFKRMVGEWKNDSEKMQKQIEFSRKYRVVIVLKRAHTSVTTPDGKVYFNSTGNPGMAKGGSGDVLTGIITSLLAQGYSSEEAAIIGVYIHGLAGDIARDELGEIAMKASDIIYFLPKAFEQFE